VLSRFTPEQPPNGNSYGPPCEIIRLEQRGWNHNGGDIEFVDRDLYLSIGDDAPQNGNGNAQDRSNLCGTVIRITPKLETYDPTYYDPKSNGAKVRITNNYEIPMDNPFADVDESLLFRSKICTFGFRNPWRTFKSDEDGKFYIGDVGQQLWEELDVLVKGAIMDGKIRRL
jgi:glucose/arabinose dehydrogenase